MHCATSLRTRRAIAIALLLVISITAAHSQTARNADLSRIRADIARLRTRLDDLRTQTRSAEHDLEEADLEVVRAERDAAPPHWPPRWRRPGRAG